MSAESEIVKLAFRNAKKLSRRAIVIVNENKCYINRATSYDSYYIDAAAQTKTGA